MGAARRANGRKRGRGGVPRVECSDVALAVAALGVTALGVAYAELLHWRASRRGMARRSPHPDFSEAIIVLGFRDHGERANLVNRYRVRAALRSVDPVAARSVLVMCGGAVGGPVAEAELMARRARECRWTGEIRIDDESRTTWENIRNAAPLVEEFDVIRIVSNSLHAEVARALLVQQRPDLADRLRPAREHRFGEVIFQKLYSVLRMSPHRRFLRNIA